MQHFTLDCCCEADYHYDESVTLTMMCFKHMEEVIRHNLYNYGNYNYLEHVRTEVLAKVYDDE